jgi:hypothetical protein
MIIRGANRKPIFWGRSAVRGADMDEAQGLPRQDENVSGQVMDSLGVDESQVSGSGEPNTESERDELPLAAKERLGRQEKRHKKELRALQDQLMRMQAQIGSSNQPRDDRNQSTDSYAYGQIQPGSAEDQIHKAVSMALRAKEDQERKAREAQQLAHVHRQYQVMQDHLDQAGDKYSDFDQVVRASDAPFTETMRDAAMILHKTGIVDPADLFYKLGKDKEALRKLSELHPLDQTSEVMKLGFAMANGSDKSASSPHPIGQIKTNPISSPDSVTDNTSVSELRRRMKAGWK